VAYPTSTVSIPVKVPLSRLAAAMDALLSPAKNGVFFVAKQTVEDGVTVRLGLHRSGPTSVSAEGEVLVLSVPLAVDDGRVDVEKSAGFLTLRGHADFTAALRVTAKVRLAVGADWRVTATVDPSFSWIEGAVVRVPLPSPLPALEVDVSGFVSPLVGQQLNRLADTARALAADLPVRARVEEAWMMAQVPVKVSDEYPVYLTLIPASVSVASVKVEGPALVLRPTVTGLVGAVLASTPPPAGRLPLPPNEARAQPDGVQINVTAYSSYADLESLATKLLQGKQFLLETGAKVRPKGLTIRAQGRTLLVRLEFEADLPGLLRYARGWVYFHATPVYDETTKRLSFEGLGFEQSTDNALVSIADWLAHSALLEQLQKQLRFDLAPQIDPIVGSLTAGTVNRTLGEGVELELVVRSLSLHGLSLGEDGLSVIVSGQGTAAVNVDPRRLVDAVAPTGPAGLR
jgi:hypothetical protein